MRKQILIVLASQILGDMLKLDGEIVDICLLLADDDVEIRNLVDNLLQALHKKDPKHMIAQFKMAFNRLSVNFATIDRDHFRQVAKVLMRNIDKLQD